MQPNPLKHLAILSCILFLLTISSSGTGVCDIEDYSTGLRHFRKRCLDFRQCFILCYNNKRCAGFWFSSQSSSCSSHHVGDYLGSPTSNERFYSLCRRRGCPESRGYVKLKRSGLCVKVSQSVKTWSKSRDTCHTEGAELVVLDSKLKYRSFRKYIAKRKFPKTNVGRRAWLGMRRSGDEKRYQWVTNQHFWAEWGPRDPSFGYERCVQISKNGMGDVRCHNPRYFICEIHNTD